MSRPGAPYRAVVHRGAGVDLDEPGVEVLVHHEVVAEELVGVLPPLHQVLRRLAGPLADLLHVRPDPLEERVFAGNPLERSRALQQLTLR